jgi:hypothetical protein
LKSIHAIAAGGSHSLALGRNGEVFSWGSSQNGQTLVSPLLRNIRAIAAGMEHSLALGEPAPAQAFARAIVDQFGRLTLDVTDPGRGYSAPPDVIITGGGGQGAIAKARLKSGEVEALELLEPGSAYVSSPFVSISPPPELPGLSIQLDTIQTVLTVRPNRTYRLESSSDLTRWDLVRDVFPSSVPRLVEKAILEEMQKCFRLVEADATPPTFHSD